MALNPKETAASEKTAGSKDAGPKKTAMKGNSGRAGGSAPAWIAVTYFVGLALVFLGQRVILLEGVSSALSWLGVAAAVIATGLRFVPRFRTQGEHAQIANLLSGLQGIGLLGLLVYFASDSASGFLKIEGEHEATLSAVLRVFWLGCVSVSASALLFAEVALNPMRSAAHLEHRRVRAAAGSGAVLALALSYGSLFIYSAADTEAQADFSYFKTSEPGEATVKLMQKLSEPIKVTAFFPEVSEVRAEVKGYLAKLKQRSQNLDFQFVDRYLQPKLAKEFKVTTDGSIVLARGESTETLRIGTEIEKARAKLKTLDQDFNAELFKLLRTRRIAYVTVGHGELNDKELGARRAEGRSAEILKQVLESQNYRVKDLGLAQGLASAVPDDAGVVLVLGPTQPFAAEEIASLRRFADSGGKLLLALDIDGFAGNEADPTGARDAHGATPGRDVTVSATSKPTPKAPPAASAKTEEQEGAAQDTAASDAAGKEEAAKDAAEKGSSAPSYDWLRELAALAGAEFEPAVVADETKFVPARNNPSDRQILFTNRFSSHASVSTLSRHSTEAAVIVMGASQLEPITDGSNKAEVTLRTYASAFADANGNFARDDSESAKAFNLSVAITRPLAAPKPKPEPKPEDEAKDDAAKKDENKPSSEDTPPDEMRGFVIADADVFSDLLMSRFRDNRVLVADAVRWLGGEESLAGEFENEEDVRVEQTKQIEVAWFYSTIFGVPLLVLGSGLLLSRRLRRGGAR